MAPMRVLVVVGTRPEAIKMAPVVQALRAEPGAFSCRVAATAQHRELLDQVLSVFGIRADDDFDLMQPDQKLPALTGRLLERLDALLEAETPDWVLAQGDTTTVLATALACYYRRVRFGHVEAGLRTGDKFFPYPEEMNRALADRLADRHFAPTRTAAAHLRAEGIPDASIVVTGNTVIDALLEVAARDDLPPVEVPESARLVLLTAHRRENFGAPMEEIFEAVRELAERHPDLHVLYPVHPNPNVRAPAERLLSGHPRITLAEPFDYLRFVSAMRASFLILTDSGGIQEEAPSLGKPVLVLRDETERPEAVEAGTVRLVGPHREIILSEAEKLLTDKVAYDQMARAINPYGDGHAAGRIVASLAGRQPGW